MAKESITCEIKRHIGILSCSTSGWRKEFNEVSWNGGAHKKAAKIPFLKPWLPLVEARGVEPLSENNSKEASPGADGCFGNLLPCSPPAGPAITPDRQVAS